MIESCEPALFVYPHTLLILNSRERKLAQKIFFMCMFGPTTTSMIDRITAVALELNQSSTFKKLVYLIVTAFHK